MMVFDSKARLSGFGQGLIGWETHKMSLVEDRLTQLGLSLPRPVAPVANYVPFVRHGNLLYIAGQVSTDAGGGIKGTVGVDLDQIEAARAARLCGLNLIAQMKAALGNLDKVSQIIKLGGFVQVGPEFTAIPAVINGCSDLMVEVFGDGGQHARSAVGVYRLPLGFAVEIDALVSVDDH